MNNSISFLCPSHDDTNPSAVYWPESDTWKCMACGARGKGKPDEPRISAKTSANTLELTEDYVRKAHHTLVTNRAHYAALEYLLKRKLTLGIITQYELGYDPECKRIIIPNYDTDRNLISVKGRDLTGQSPKYVHAPGSKTYYYRLDLANKVSNTANLDYIIVFEGEFNMLSSVVINPNLPVTAVGGSKNLRQGWEYPLKEKSRIYLVYDDDTPGFEGATQASTILGGDRCFRVNLNRPGKDLNDLLVSDPEVANIYRTALTEAPIMEPDRLKDWEVGLKQALRNLKYGLSKGISTGFEEVDNLMGGFARKEPVLLAADAGAGKTTLSSAIVYNIAVTQGIPTCILSLDAHFEKAFVTTVINRHLGKNLEYVDTFTNAQLNQIYEECRNFDNIRWLEHRGKYKHDVVEKDVIKAYEQGSRFFVIDYLQKMAYNENDAADIGKAVGMIEKLRNTLPEATWLVICQTNRNHLHDMPVEMSNLKGSSSIEQFFSTIVALDRIKGKYSLRLLKIRSNAVKAEVGDKVGVLFNKATFEYEFVPVIT